MTIENKDYVIPPPPVPSIPVRGGGRFPVRRVYCVGRNYRSHAREMGYSTDREWPFFFQKNPNNLRADGKFPYPQQSKEVHHEVELMMALGSGGRNIPVSRGLRPVWGYGIALDMTCRDLQQKAKDKGRPWESSKAFESSAPCSELVPVTECGHPFYGQIYLWRNGQLGQSGDVGQKIFKLSEVVSFLSYEFELAAGDVILTGTPAGIGPVEVGDHLKSSIDGVGTLEVTVIEPE